MFQWILNIAIIVFIIILVVVIGCMSLVYTQQHPKLQKVIAGKDAIVCVGDSITYGAGVWKTRKKDSYPAILQTLVPKNYQVLNYGLSGRTLQDEGDMPYRREKAFMKSLNCKANKYILMLGTNDSKPVNWNPDRFENELDVFVKYYLELESKPDVILMQPPRSFPKEGTDSIVFDISNDRIKEEIYGSIGQIAEKYGLQVIDLYQLTEKHPEWFADGVHPNRVGNQMISEEIAKYM